jgi:hypothetical protein
VIACIRDGCFQIDTAVGTVTNVRRSAKCRNRVLCSPSVIHSDIKCVLIGVMSSSAYKDRLCRLLYVSPFVHIVVRMSALIAVARPATRLPAAALPAAEQLWHNGCRCFCVTCCSEGGHPFLSVYTNLFIGSIAAGGKGWETGEWQSSRC